jgi:glycosyltransferase involved in cell wall biosynthesis
VTGVETSREAADGTVDVLHVCDFANHAEGNFIPSFFAVALRARERFGLQTGFVFPETARGAPWVDTLERERVRVAFIDRSAGRVARVRAIRELLAQRGVSLVHSHFTYFDIDCAVAARTSGTRTIWHLHSGIHPYTTSQRVRDVLKVRMIGRTCARVVACAPWIADQAVERGFPLDKLRMVPNAIVLERFAAERDRHTCRRAFNLDSAARVVLAFCWDPHRKGADLLVRAGRVLVERKPDVEIVLVGEERLDAYVDEVLGGERPQWLRIMRPVEDSASLLRAADVFVNASRHEGMAYAIAEAMAAGLPVVASNIPGSALYFPAEGLTRFETENAAALLEALEEVLDSSDLQAQGQRNRRFALRHCGIDGFTRGIVDVYGELLRTA